MSNATKSDSMLSLRLPGELKQVIEQAAEHLGQTVTDFAISTLVRGAHEVIQQHDRTELSNRDRDTFLALLGNVDAEPNEALVAAAENYKQQID